MKRKTRKIIICRCEDVSIDEVEKAIEVGYKDLGDIKHLLRCGMGPCQGRTCMKQIAQTLSRKTGKRISTMKFPSTRPPIRPIPFGIFVPRIAEKSARNRNQLKKE